MRHLKSDLEALARANAVLDHIERILPHKARDSKQAPAVGALVTVSMQHFRALLALAEMNNTPASLEALFRTVFECWLRFIWMTENRERGRQILNREASFPSLTKLVSGAAKHQNRELLQLKKAITSLHAGAHGGLEQLERYYPGGAASKRDRTSILEIPVFCNYIGLLSVSMAIGFEKYMGRVDSADELEKLLVNKVLAQSVMDLAAFSIRELKRATKRTLRMASKQSGSSTSS